MADPETQEREGQQEQQNAPAKVTWWHWHRRLYDWVVHFSLGYPF